MSNELSTEVVQGQDITALLDAAQPKALIAKGKAIAEELSKLIEEKKMYKVIGEDRLPDGTKRPKKYVLVDAWSTLGAILGITPHVEYCRRVDTQGTSLDYEARVVLRDKNGREWGSGEALCSSNESNWSNRDEFAIRSMCQTRATGKAFRLAFSWIVVLGGYQPTPAEEMTGAPQQKPPIQQPQQKPAAPISSEAENKMRSDLSHILLEVCGGVEPRMADTLYALTSYIDKKTGDKVEGLRDLEKLKGKRLEVTLDRAKRSHESWKKQQETY